MLYYHRDSMMSSISGSLGQEVSLKRKSPEVNTCDIVLTYLPAGEAPQATRARWKTKQKRTNDEKKKKTNKLLYKLTTDLTD